MRVAPPRGVHLTTLAVMHMGGQDKQSSMACVFVRVCALRVWDLSTGSCTKTWSGHAELLNCITFGADGKTVVTGAEDKTIR